MKNKQERNMNADNFKDLNPSDQTRFFEFALITLGQRDLLRKGS